ncbi:MAG: hypothetical protein V4446_14080 [Pseudomonadota bacterium]|uniref:hypothetical protein n=1 Tax=Sulfuriferula sp. TaxID=2025307 RepID=UPI000ECBEA90|nr:hypothetical protein [Sulfuriferula sp.]MDP2025786.1 hypothetical protein [Sulfuriferula sp.]HAN54692.1 hypothetical protein [Betaproteobacteria bacterium]
MNLPSYEVEFIPIERRLNERRSPIAQLQRNEPYLGVDRRAEAGRRASDEAAYQAFLSKLN